MQADWGYVVIWEFRVQPGMEADFERAYGSEGGWAQLFRTGDGFSGTELHRDVSVPGRYVTLDFWSSGEAYQRFRQRNAARYAAIDAECQSLTESEVEIGSFARVGEYPGRCRLPGNPWVI